MRERARTTEDGYTGQTRLFVIVALVLLAVGVAMLVLGAQRLLTGSGDDSFAPVYVRPISQDSAAAGASEGPRLFGDQSYRIVIEKIDVDAPVATFGLDAEGIPQVPFEPFLVAWYDFSAVPGSGGNAVFAGHYTWFGDAVFRQLEDLAEGDRVILRNQDGSELIYEVTETLLTSPIGEQARRWMGHVDADVITLITCGGTFTETGDPIFGGEYDQRQIVRAALIDSRP
jgi:LPXTG-site transpeptidase (sortase) family protein